MSARPLLANIGQRPSWKRRPGEGPRPQGEKLTPDPQGPAWGPAEDRAAWSAVLRHPHGAEGAASVPGDACVPLRRRGHPAPKADPEGLVAANTHRAVAGGRGLCAGLALPVPCLRPTASLSGRFLPRGPDAARPTDAQGLPSASHSILGSQVRDFHCCPMATFHRGQMTGPKPALWRSPGSPLTETRPSAHRLPAILVLSPPEPLLLLSLALPSLLCKGEDLGWKEQSPLQRA